MASNGGSGAHTPQTQAQVQPCRYKTGKTLGAGSYSVVKECVHIDTGRYYAAKVINKRLMAGREHMVRAHLMDTPAVRLMRARSEMRLLC
jgi:calcium/calmodulin-dependent protein kinase I